MKLKMSETHRVRFNDLLTPFLLSFLSIKMKSSGITFVASGKISNNYLLRILIFIEMEKEKYIYNRILFHSLSRIK